MQTLSCLLRGAKKERDSDRSIEGERKRESDCGPCPVNATFVLKEKIQRDKIWNLLRNVFSISTTNTAIYPNAKQKLWFRKIKIV